MFLYCITNELTGKSYIGITSMPKARFSDHSRTKSLIGNAIRKYGKENFKMTILVEGTGKYISDLEPTAILSFCTLHPNGHNLSLQTQKSFKHHEESIEKMRKPKSDEARKNMSLAKTGKPNGRKGIFEHTLVTKEKIRYRLIGIPKSESFKDNLRGRQLSPEHRKNIGNALAG